MTTLNIKKAPLDPMTESGATLIILIDVAAGGTQKTAACFGNETMYNQLTAEQLWKFFEPTLQRHESGKPWVLVSIRAHDPYLFIK